MHRRQLGCLDRTSHAHARPGPYLLSWFSALEGFNKSIRSFKYVFINSLFVTRVDIALRWAHVLIGGGFMAILIFKCFTRNNIRGIAKCQNS